MTSGEPGPVPQEASAHGGPASEGCLYVVASFDYAASFVSAVVQEASTRIMMSPMLGDFIEVRFADIGPKPKPEDAHDRSAVVARIAGALLSPDSGAERNFFALVIADDSAEDVEQVLRDCAADPVVAGLPARFRGIANRDDRKPVAGSGPPMEIAISPAGMWGDSELVTELRRYGEDLLLDFAAGHEPGLSPDELRMLRSKVQQDSPEAPPEPTEPPEPAQLQEPAEPAEPAELPEPPERMELPEPPERMELPEPAEPQDTAEPLEPGALAPEVPDRPLVPRAQERVPEPEKREPHAQPLSPPQQGSSRPLLRRLPVLRRARGRDAGRDADPQKQEPPQDQQEQQEPPQRRKTRVRGLVYLVIISDERSPDSSAWRRSRRTLLEIDQKMAALPQVACKTRALRSSGDVIQGELRFAGELSRKDIKRPVSDPDFGHVLDSIREMLGRDRPAIELPGTPMARPAVVIFTADPPLADTITAEAYRQLAGEASIMWVMPRSSADLLTPVFTDKPGTRLVLDHPEVADEVAALLNELPVVQTGSQR